MAVIESRTYFARFLFVTLSFLLAGFHGQSQEIQNPHIRPLHDWLTLSMEQMQPEQAVPGVCEVKIYNCCLNRKGIVKDSTIKAIKNFNEKGFLIRSEKFDKNETVQARWEYYYAADLLDSAVVFFRSDYSYHYRFEYNKSGKVTRQYRISSKNHVLYHHDYAWDNLGRLISFQTTKYYYAHAAVIRLDSVRAYPPLVIRYDDLNKTATAAYEDSLPLLIYTFNEKNQIIREVQMLYGSAPEYSRTVTTEYYYSREGVLSGHRLIMNDPSKRNRMIDERSDYLFDNLGRIIYTGKAEIIYKGNSALIFEVREYNTCLRYYYHYF